MFEHFFDKDLFLQLFLVIITKEDSYQNNDMKKLNDKGIVDERFIDSVLQREEMEIQI